jgi:two-component system response regulator RegX3
MARILVVEDEETLAEAISFLLSKEGFDVAVAATGPAAIESFEKSGADLIR